MNLQSFQIRGLYGKLLLTSVGFSREWGWERVHKIESAHNLRTLKTLQYFLYVFMIKDKHFLLSLFANIFCISHQITNSLMGGGPSLCYYCYLFSSWHRPQAQRIVNNHSSWVQLAVLRSRMIKSAFSFHFIFECWGLTQGLMILRTL